MAPRISECDIKIGLTEINMAVYYLWKWTDESYSYTLFNKSLLKGSLWVCVFVCVCVRNFLNCYKMANNGWILEFKVSKLPYQHA